VKDGSTADFEAFLKLLQKNDNKFTISMYYPTPEVFEGVSSGFARVEKPDGSDEHVEVWRTVEGKVVAIPQDELVTWLDEHGCSNGHDWRTNNWGSKWDVEAPFDLRQWNPRQPFEFEFESAWGPPRNAILKLSELFPSFAISLEYTEPGCGFAGWLEMQGGALMREDYTEELRIAKEWTPWLEDELEYVEGSSPMELLTDGLDGDLVDEELVDDGLGEEEVRS